MLAHSILMRRFGLGLWIPWRHFWNEFQVLQHLKEQDFKSCIVHRKIFRLIQLRCLELIQSPIPTYKSVLQTGPHLVWASALHPTNTRGTLSGNSPHIRHVTFEVPLPFPVFLWWYNLVGNICWYSPYVATMVWGGKNLQLFIHAKHTPLSGTKSSHLFLVSFPCHSSSLSVSQ